MNSPNSHQLPTNLSLNHVLETKILTAYFYGDIVVVEANEGVTLSYNSAFSILVAGLKQLKNKPFVYIAHRVNSYSVNPNDYVYLEKVPTLKGIAIVAPNELAKKNAKLELNFFNKPMDIFDDVKAAYEWSKDLLTPLN